MSDREPLSGPDNAWRRMGTANNLTDITGVLWFDEPITYEELCDRLEERLLRFDRFKQHVGGQERFLRQPYWELDENFDIQTHVYDLALPEPQDKATFQRFISNLMSRPLDERRALWEAYLIHGAGDGDGNALAFRINHSIGDGFALLYVLFGLADNPEEIEMPMGIVPNPPRADEFQRDEARADGTEEARANGAGEYVESTAGEETEHGAEAEDGRGGDTGGPAVSDDGGSGSALPGTDDGGLLDTLALGPKAVTAAWGLLTQEDEVDTSLRGDIGTVKRAAWTEEIDLEVVRSIGDVHDATINDVLLGALAGAFRRLLEDRGEHVEGLELRTTVPVNLKPMEDRSESLGNYFGLVFVPLPIGTPDLGERVEIIHERMDQQKAGIEAYLMGQIIRFAGVAPDFVQDLLMTQFEDQATGVVTNVPGPLDTIEFAGREVEDLMFWVPQANDQGVGVSIFSYDGGVRLGIAGDENLLPEPELVAEAFEAEISELADDLE